MAGQAFWVGKDKGRAKGEQIISRREGTAGIPFHQILFRDVFRSGHRASQDCTNEIAGTVSRSPI